MKIVIDNVSSTSILQAHIIYLLDNDKKFRNYFFLLYGFAILKWFFTHKLLICNCKAKRYF